MVHRLLNYFYILAFHARLKAHHWRDWDHRNLLHVWPFKAFHRDGSQVRIYWNQFLSEIWMLAHQSCPVWSIHFKKEKKLKLKKREREKNNLLDCWKWAAFKSIPNTFVCLPPKLKRLWNKGWRKCWSIVLNQGRNTKTESVPQRFTSKGASHFVSYLIS